MVKWMKAHQKVHPKICNILQSACDARKRNGWANCSYKLPVLNFEIQLRISTVEHWRQVKSLGHNRFTKTIITTDILLSHSAIWTDFIPCHLHVTDAASEKISYRVICRWSTNNKSNSNKKKITLLIKQDNNGNNNNGIIIHGHHILQSQIRPKPTGE